VALQGYRNPKLCWCKYGASVSWGNKGCLRFEIPFHAPCTNNDGTNLNKHKKDILSLWAEHLEDLLNQTNPVDPSIIDQLPKLPSVPRKNLMFFLPQKKYRLQQITWKSTRHLALMVHLPKSSNTASVCCYSD